MAVSIRLLLAHFVASYALASCIALFGGPSKVWSYLPNTDLPTVLLPPICVSLHVVGLVLLPCIGASIPLMQTAVALPVVHVAGMAVAYFALAKSQLCRTRLDTRTATRLISCIWLVLLACLLVEWIRYEWIRWGTMGGLGPMGGLSMWCAGRMAPDTEVIHRALGFEIGQLESFSTYLVALKVPYWLLMIVTGVAARPWLRAAWREHLIGRRASLGQCLACGYDLRASPDRCPECGSPIPVQTPSSAKL